MPSFIANRAAIDFITVTTFDPLARRQLTDFALTPQEKRDAGKAKIPRYVGQRAVFDDGSMFWGEGQQDGASHYLFQVAGATADRFCLLLSSVDLPPFSKVTRIDVQLTLPRPDWFSSRDYVEHMRETVWKGRTRKVVAYDNYGDDTVYIGSWASDMFIRLYVKDAEWMRFEVVYKGGYAKDAWDRYRKATMLAPAGMLVHELMRLPQHPIHQMFLEQLKHANAIAVQMTPPIKTMNKTYKWLRDQVTPAIIRLLNDHECGAMTRAHLEELIADDYD